MKDKAEFAHGALATQRRYLDGFLRILRLRR